MSTKSNYVSYPYQYGYVSNDYQKFLNKRVTYGSIPLFFPEGFEGLFLMIYFVTLPYIAGLIFLFFYLTNNNMKLVNTMDLYQNAPFISVWAIGYEVLAVFALLAIVVAAIKHNPAADTNQNKIRYLYQ